MPQAALGTWDGDLAVRLPAEIVRATGLHDGERVEIDARGGDIVIRRVAPKVDLDRLFEGKIAAAWRAQYSGAYDWGSDMGRESIPE